MSSRYLSVARPDNETITSGLNNVGGNFLDAVQSHDPPHLGEQAFHQPEVAARDPNHCSLSLDRVKLGGIEAAREAGTLDQGLETVRVDHFTVLADELLRTDPVTRNMDAVKNNRIIMLDAHAMQASLRLFSGMDTLAQAFASGEAPQP